MIFEVWQDKFNVLKTQITKEFGGINRLDDESLKLACATRGRILEPIISVLCKGTEKILAEMERDPKFIDAIREDFETNCGENFYLHKQIYEHHLKLEMAKGKILLFLQERA